MRDRAPPISTPQRYRLAEALGSGSMGVVYRAHDCLSDQDVALKQVSLRPGIASDEVEQELIALANEFRTLAGLRHPHIIDVLDYGFDALRRPFYTMELLDGARSILDVGHAQPIADRVSLLLQVLEALSYLHRHGILHHDLKPANILVANGRARLLDFGLAVLAHQQRDNDAFGTLQYLAPEVLSGQPYTPAADLYSLGVIAYELLIGRYPFSAASLDAFLSQVEAEQPDLSALAQWPALATVIAALMAKAPADRPASAQATIAALRAAVGRDVAGESTAIRESYLQAARFVGREAELATLSGALDMARQGRGSGWLVGGESGVGKSRLLDELRILALVRGFQVLRGQASEGGVRPGQLWREPLRQLALGSELDDLAAGVLLDQIDDLGELIGRPIPPPPQLVGKAAQERLIYTIGDLFRRQTQPTLLLLEDLQWMTDSPALLTYLLRVAPTMSLCIVAIYRDDAGFDLAALRGAAPQQLRLGRLSSEDISSLSRSILGDDGGSPGVVAFLQRQTEGNVYFLVEVIRALAEEAGDLARIGRQSLPQTVLTGGVQQFVRRRLGQVPAWGQEALQIAAVIGRRVDLPLLATLCPTIDIGRWRLLCTDAVVFEVVGGTWQFSHDKLREMLLADMDRSLRQTIHRRVAEALEDSHEGGVDQLSALFEHWHGAGQNDLAARYAEQAARGLIRASAYGDARAILDRALPVAASGADGPLHIRLLTLAGEVDKSLSDYERAMGALDAAVRLAEAADDQRLLAGALDQLGDLLRERGQYPEALARLVQARSIWQGLGDREGLARSLIWIGTVQDFQGRIHDAIDSFTQGLAYCHELGLSHEIAECQISLGSLRLRLENSPAAWEELEAGMRLAEELASPDLRYYGMHRIAMLSIARADLDTAIQYQTQALGLAHDMGQRRSEVACLINLGNIYARQANYAEGVRSWERGLSLAREINAWNEIALCLINLAEIRHNVGGDPTAEAYASEALAIIRASGSPVSEGYVLHLLGDIARDSGNFARAQQQYDLAMAVSEKLNLPSYRLDVLTKRGKLAWVQRDWALAQSYQQQALSLARQLNNRAELIDNLAQVVSLALHRGLGEEARSALIEGLELARDLPRLIVVNNLLVSLAEWLIGRGDLTLAAAVYSYVRAHPMVSVFIRRYRLPAVELALYARSGAAWTALMAGGGGGVDSPEAIIAQGLALARA